jgi:hypothetical protein
VAARTPAVRILSSAQVTRVATLSTHAELDYLAPPALPPLPSNGGGCAVAPTTQRLSAPLLVAADSRFSATRRQLGIGAQMTDFGRTVIVCRMRHAQPHGNVAHECFGYERTLAVLPLPDAPEGHPLCSVVVTAGSADAAALMALSAHDFAAQVQAQFDQRLGAMELVGERYAYPLVAVYAQRFAGHRCALLGDAAVGMHPVTAHGYNLGLSGVERLTAALVDARQRGQDIGNPAALECCASWCCRARGACHHCRRPSWASSRASRQCGCACWRPQRPRSFKKHSWQRLSVLACSRFCMMNVASLRTVHAELVEAPRTASEGVSRIRRRTRFAAQENAMRPGRLSAPRPPPPKSPAHTAAPPATAG